MSKVASREDAKARRDIEEVAAMVVDASLQLHRDLGPGLQLHLSVPLIDLQNQFAAIVEKVEDLRSRYQQITRIMRASNQLVYRVPG